MCITYNDYGQVIHRFSCSDTAISYDRSPLAYHELTDLDNLKCGWKLLQEWIWACSPHIRGTYHDYRALIHQMLPLANKLIVVYYRRAYELSREIILSHDATGMEHELLHHFVQTLSRNGEHGYIQTFEGLLCMHKLFFHSLIMWCLLLYASHKSQTFM
jgi:hypothetical protein